MEDLTDTIGNEKGEKLDIHDDLEVRLGTYRGYDREGVLAVDYYDNGVGIHEYRDGAEERKMGSIVLLRPEIEELLRTLYVSGYMEGWTPPEE